MVPCVEGGMKLFVFLNELRGTSTPLTFKICELWHFKPRRALLALRLRQSDFALRLRRLIQLPLTTHFIEGHFRIIVSVCS